MKDPDEHCWDFVIAKATGSICILSRGKGSVYRVGWGDANLEAVSSGGWG